MPNKINSSKWSSEEEYKWKFIRWKCRYDLKFLCNEVLDYPDVGDQIHGYLINNVLQKFPAPTKEQFYTNDQIINSYVFYKPLLPNMTQLEGIRRRLILDFRGSLKTSINCTAHAIQWIINYPNCALLVCQSTQEKANDILKVIKEVFQYNQTFRTFFPEHCPQKKVDDWGIKEKFTSEARDYTYTRREETCHAAGLDQGMAGYHFDVMKFSDIVEPQNTKTLNSCKETIKQFGLMENCLVSPMYWIDVEGTRYTHADLYGRIIDNEEDIRKKYGPTFCKWKIYSRGVYKKDLTKLGYKEYKFTPEELTLSDLIDPDKRNLDIPEDYKKISWWPERHTLEDLAYKKSVNAGEFASQQQNYPQTAEEGMKPFLVGDKFPIKIARDTFKQRILTSFYDMSVDTAETTGSRSDYTSIAIGAISESGKMYIVEIKHGKFLPDLLIDHIIEMYLKYKPRSIKMEDMNFNRGLYTGLSREAQKLNVYLPMEWIKRDNQQSKIDRISKTLQPWYISGDLRFVKNDPDIQHEHINFEHLEKELDRFPSYEHDDMLDSISDLFQGREYFGREIPRVREDQQKIAFKMDEKDREHLWNLYLGIGDIDKQTSKGSFYDKTGGL